MVALAVGVYSYMMEYTERVQQGASEASPPAYIPYGCSNVLLTEIVFIVVSRKRPMGSAPCIYTQIVRWADI